MIMNPLVSLSAQPATIPQHSSRRGAASGAQLWQVPQPLLPTQYRQPLPPKKFPQIQPTRLIPKRSLRARRHQERLQKHLRLGSWTLSQCDNKYGSST